MREHVRKASNLCENTRPPPMQRQRCSHREKVRSGYSDGKINDMDTVRLDKWLWAARFFKTRTLAGRACELGRVQCKKQPVKPSRAVHVGEFLQIRTEGGDFEVEVLLLSEVRGPASVAQTLYRESESSREKRLTLAQERRAGMLFTPAPDNRPSKRDRRKIREFRGE